MEKVTSKPETDLPDDAPPGAWPEPTIESLRQKLLDGMNSPIAGEMNDAYFDALRARLRARAPR